MEVLLVVVAVVVVIGVVVALVARRGAGSTRPRTVDLEPPAAVPVGGEIAVEESVGGEMVIEEMAGGEIAVEGGVEEVHRPRVRDRLTRARDRFAGAIGALRGSRVDDRTWEELEDALLSADVGVTPTTELLAAVRTSVAEQGITEGDGVLEVLKDQMRQRLGSGESDLALALEAPTVWLLVGVNGVGKTTTAGKLARRQVAAGHRVMLAAGDTFRAAAAEQLGMWAERTGADLVRGEAGGDPSAVVFDAVEAAAARGHDLVIADTAGRLHTKSNLMDELAKVRRVADKGAGTVTESLLVLDATTGQNGLVQARQFAEAVDLTGVVLTKLDGSAKGGIVLAIQSELGVPVKLVGLGEGADDLVPFDADEFVEALFS